MALLAARPIQDVETNCGEDSGYSRAECHSAQSAETCVIDTASLRAHIIIDVKMCGSVVHLLHYTCTRALSRFNDTVGPFCLASEVRKKHGCCVF